MKTPSVLRRGLTVIVLCFVLGFSVMYAIAWIQLYLRPHAYRVASEWIFENVPQGSVLLGPHWDDRLPLSIPGKDAPRYYVMEGRDAELPLYERDTKEKLNLVLQRSAKADYIIFPTARLSDSIPRVPEEYPYSTAYLQLLWSEKLGFKFLKSIKDRPSFLGFTFNDDLADESFSVYDHPKVVIFQNTERLSLEAMRERVLNPKKYEPLPTMNEILLMDDGGWAATAVVPNPRLRKTLQLGALVFALALGFWITLGSRISFLPDRGLGLSVSGGLALGGGIAWLLAVLGLTPFNDAVCVFAAGLVVFGGILTVCTSAAARHRIGGASRRHALSAVLAIVSGVGVVAVMRVEFPDLFWSSGEFERFALSFFSRNETIPPDPSWSSSAGRGGLYAHSLVAGWLSKLVGVSGTLAYELWFVVVGGAVGGALYSGLAAILRRPLYALALTLVALVPAVRGAHVVLNGHSAVQSAQAEVHLDSSEQRLVDWLRESLPGAPLVVEACDVTPGVKVAMKAGLPIFSAEGGEGDRAHDQKRAEAQKAACSLADPEAAYRAMMSYGVGLIVIPGRESSVVPGRESAIARFVERRDLFASIYSEEGSVVIAAAFSEHFPRAFSH